MFPSVPAAVIEGNEFEKAEQVLDVLGDVEFKVNALHSVYIVTALQLALTNGLMIDPTDPATVPVELFAKDLASKLSEKSSALKRIFDTGWEGVESARVRYHEAYAESLRAGLKAKPLSELRKLAKEKKIKRFSSLKHRELVEALLG